MAREKKNTRDWSRLRLILVGGVFAVIWLGLWGRAYYLQVQRGPVLAEQAKRQHVAAEFERGERGEILDRNGKQLAKSAQFISIYARPLEIVKPAEAAKVLARALDDSQAKLTKKLSSDSKFVWVARQVSDKAAAQIKEANIQGVYLTSEYGRLYPNGHLAGQLLGFVGVDDKGLEGIERSMEERLAGGKAEFVVQRDASGQRLYLDSEGREVDIDGKDVRLTIDANIQFVAEDALMKTVTRYKGTGGTCLVVKVDSGEILAWATYPFFNPNIYRSYKPDAWRNRIATDSFEPGSTMKPFLVASALEEKVVGKDSMYFCENGKWKIPSGKTVKDTHKYEWLPVHKIIRYSSNIGSGKIGLALGGAKYSTYLHGLGFGERTNLSLPGESKGLLRPASVWAEIDLVAAAFGQGVGVTVLQMARAYVCLASGGMLKPLKLVIDPPREYEPERRVFSAKNASLVMDMLKDVVEEDGTGTMARIPGVNIAGKTGTAQKAKAGGGYGDKYMSSFIGLLPAESPEYLVMVIVDEPDQQHYGGVVAAPAVRDVVIKTLAYLGKLPEDTAAMEEETVRHAQAATVAVTGDAQRHNRVAEKGSMPDVVGLPLRKAIEMLSTQGIVPILEGQGLFVTKQSPAPGESLSNKSNAKFILWLSNKAGV